MSYAGKVERLVAAHVRRAFCADLSARGPYATREDKQTAQSLGVSVRELRADRAAEDALGGYALRRAARGG